jgi:hypothetical protein
MAKDKKQLYESMRNKVGGKYNGWTDEEIDNFFKESGKKRKIRGTGGFYRNPALAKSAQSKSVESRLKKKEE